MAKRTSSTRRPKRTRRPVSRRAAKNRAPRRRRRAAVRSEKRRRARPTRRAKASPKTRRKARPAKRPPRRVPVWTQAPASPAHTQQPPTLSRERRRLPDEERVDPARVDARLVAEARSGHDAVVASLKRHHESSPELTAGDVDAKWDDAYAIGDEAPGGDNPTPDQNEVDAIGRAIGAEYEDDEELMGGDEIGARDAHRWELDPQSRDDAEGDDDK